MNLPPIIDRLKAGGVPAEGLAALIQLRVKPRQSFPAIFVAPDRETGLAPRDLTGVHDQGVNCDFLVVIHLDGNSVRLDADIERLTGKVDELLTGWVHPDAEGEATAFRSQQLFEIENGRVAMMMKFGTYRRIRRAVTTGDAA